MGLFQNIIFIFGIMLNFGILEKYYKQLNALIKIDIMIPTIALNGTIEKNLCHHLPQAQEISTATTKRHNMSNILNLINDIRQNYP
jgi:hypothetical protein